MENQLSDQPYPEYDTKTPTRFQLLATRNTRVHRDQDRSSQQESQPAALRSRVFSMSLKVVRWEEVFFSKARDFRKIWRLLRECRSLYIENDGLTRKASKSGSKLRVWKHSCGFLSFSIIQSVSHKTICNTSSICST